MSVWKSVKSAGLTKETNKDMLAEALKELGIGLDYNTKVISNSYGKTEVDVAFVNLKTNKVVSLGIKYDADGAVTLLGDPWATGFGSDGGHQAVLDKIAQMYQKVNVSTTLVNHGYVVSEQTTNAQGDIVIKAYQY